METILDLIIIVMLGYVIYRQIKYPIGRSYGRLTTNISGEQIKFVLRRRRGDDEGDQKDQGPQEA